MNTSLFVFMAQHFDITGCSDSDNNDTRRQMFPGLALTFNVMSSEQEASRFPVGSHLIAFTSFWKEKRPCLWCIDSIFISVHLGSSSILTNPAIQKQFRPNIPMNSDSNTDSTPSKSYTSRIKVHVWLWNMHKQSTYCVSLECLNGPVLSQFADVDAHVCTTGGKCIVALPINV